MSDVTSRSWFAVFNNPAEHGYPGTPQEVCDRLRDEWHTQEHPERSGAWVYCISEKGLHHIHMVLEDNQPIRFSQIRGKYCPGMHLEETKGLKKQVEDYIHKTGQFAEKGEQIIYSCDVGTIYGGQGRRSDLVAIYDYVQRGMTPVQILDTDPKFYKNESIIRKMYFQKRSADTPAVRDVRVIWHTGESGSGKSFSRVQLINEVGEDQIYYLTDYTSSSMFDGYNGEPYLWLEDFKGEMKFGLLLRLLDVYKADLHARYTNCKALWNEVHITSVMHPKGIYHKMVDRDKSAEDKVEQLLRRITCIRYHYKVGDEYFSLDFPVTATMHDMAMACKDVIPII